MSEEALDQGRFRSQYVLNQGLPWLLESECSHSLDDLTPCPHKIQILLWYGARLLWEGFGFLHPCPLSEIWLYRMPSFHLPPLPSSLMTLSAPAERLTEPHRKQMGHSLLQWVKLLEFNKSKLIKVFGTKTFFFHCTDPRDWPHQKVNSAKMRTLSSSCLFFTCELNEVKERKESNVPEITPNL